MQFDLSAKSVCLAAALMLVISAGCGPRNLAKVTGKVTVDGQPMPFGRIQFSPVAAKDATNADGKPAQAYLASDGTFELTTYKKNDGAVIGSHRVSIVNEQPEGSDASKPKSIPSFEVLNLVGKRYEVAKGENDIHIELTSDIIRQFARED